MRQFVSEHGHRMDATSGKSYSSFITPASRTIRSVRHDEIGRSKSIIDFDDLDTFTKSSEHQRGVFIVFMDPFDFINLLTSKRMCSSVCQ